MKKFSADYCFREAEQMIPKTRKHIYGILQIAKVYDWLGYEEISLRHYQMAACMQKDQFVST